MLWDGKLQVLHACSWLFLFTALGSGLQRNAKVAPLAQALAGLMEQLPRIKQVVSIALLHLASV